MLNISASRNQFQTLNSDLNDALLVYERRFGYTPDWLEDFTQSRVLALILQALNRGAPLTAADVLH